MAQTVSAQTLHETFRYYYDNQNAFLAPPVGKEEIDLLLNFAQRQIQGDEFRAYRAADGRGFEGSKERKRNLQAFLNADPIKATFLNTPTVLPARMKLPDDHRYTVVAEVSWHGQPKVFYTATAFDHEEWIASKQNAFQTPTYYEPAIVSHDGFEEIVAVEYGYLPAELRLWYLRLPKLISLDNKFGMELPEWLQERVVQAAVSRGKFIAEVAGANFQQALRTMTE